MLLDITYLQYLLALIKRALFCESKPKYFLRRLRGLNYLASLNNVRFVNGTELFRFRHQAREGEPRDYDLSSDPVRDLRRSTYQHLGVASAAVSTIFMNISQSFTH